VPERPYVLLSAAVSADGYIDDATADRLVLSDAADLDRVDDVRAGVDAILVGAGTIRADNPRLLVRSAARRAARAAAGGPASPVRVTLTSRGGLDPAARFFTAEAGSAVETASLAGTGGTGAAGRTNRTGGTGAAGSAGGTGVGDGPGERVVYAAGPVAERVREQLSGTGAVIVDLGVLAAGAGGGAAGAARGAAGAGGGAGAGPAGGAGGTGGLGEILADLGRRGVGRLLVEGGAGVLTAFLAAGLADELQLMVAPFFVGSGVRMTKASVYPHGPGNPMKLAEVGRLGDAVLLRYLL
jgi:5-amino-6-(5-phosphoribosylamino)uracil reductase